MDRRSRESLPPSYRKPVANGQPDGITNQATSSSSLDNSTNLPYSPSGKSQANPISPQESHNTTWVESKAYQPVPGTHEVESNDEHRSQPTDMQQRMPSMVISHHRRRLFWWALRYALVVVVVFVAFLIPLIVLSNDDDIAEGTAQTIQEKQSQALVFYICLWLEVTWVGAVFSDLIGLGFPYLFRFIARYVSDSRPAPASGGFTHNVLDIQTRLTRDIGES